MKTKKRISQKGMALVLSVLLFLSFAVNVSAEKTVSVFAATDRHAHYETTQAEAEGAQEAPPEAPPEGAEKAPPKGPKKTPVYDAEGALIWHNHLTDVLSLVRQDPKAVQPEIVLLGGDHIGEGSDRAIDETGYPMGAPAFSMKAVDAQIAYVFGDAARGLYTYGSHDVNETGNYAEAFFSGPVRCDGFYLYGISFAQMIYDSDLQAVSADERGRTYGGKDLADPNGVSAQTASHLFLSWAKSLEDHWPVIVMSHVPLHAQRGDNSGAWTWTRALNEAAENRDIIFLWGHNHTLEKDEETAAAEQAHYLLLPGQEITVQSWAMGDEGKMILRREIPPEPAETETAETETTETAAAETETAETAAAENEPAETEAAGTDVAETGAAETAAAETAEAETETTETTETETGAAETEAKPRYRLITERETLRFVYMNAGYITNGIGSLLTFTDVEEDGEWDRLTVRRYALEAEAEEWTVPLRKWSELP